MRVAVVGGGISGLAAAHFLTGAGHDVVCVDPGPAPGGVMQSQRHQGFLCETGPQAVLDGAPATRRFLYRGGRLVALPTSPPGLLRSPLLSFRGKLRLLCEPFIRRPPAV